MERYESNQRNYRDRGNKFEGKKAQGCKMSGKNKGILEGMKSTGIHVKGSEWGKENTGIRKRRRLVNISGKESTRIWNEGNTREKKA